MHRRINNDTRIESCIRPCLCHSTVDCGRAHIHGVLRDGIYAEVVYIARPGATRRCYENSDRCARVSRAEENGEKYVWSAVRPATRPPTQKKHANRLLSESIFVVEEKHRGDIARGRSSLS